MIEVEGLSKFYGPRSALERLSFSVAPGEVVGFLGPNGAGKTTTMNILAGFLSPSEGRVRINGYDILAQAQQARSCVGYLPEQPPLYPELTVQEYLRHVCALKKCKNRRNAELQRLLPMCGLAEVSARKIAHLSKGFRQRVGLAQALIGQPPLLILDEPTAGLDPQQILEIRNLIRQLRCDHTILISSHILSEIEAVCQRMLILCQGRLVADGSAESLNRQLQVCQLQLEVLATGNEDQLAAVLATLDIAEFSCHCRSEGVDKYLFQLELLLPGAELALRQQLSCALHEQGFAIISMQLQRHSLENIFLRLTGEQS